MADISNLKIEERSNVERLLLRVPITNNETWEDKESNSFISKGKYKNRQNCEWCEISNGRTIPKFANFRNFNNFPNFKNSEIFLNFWSCKSLKICYFTLLENSKNLQFKKIEKFEQLGNFSKSYNWPVWKIWKMMKYSTLFNLEN